MSKPNYVGQRVVHRDPLGAYEYGTVVSVTDPDHPIVDFDRYGQQIMDADMVRPFSASPVVGSTPEGQKDA